MSILNIGTNPDSRKLKQIYVKSKEESPYRNSPTRKQMIMHGLSPQKDNVNHSALGMKKNSVQGARHTNLLNNVNKSYHTI